MCGGLFPLLRVVRVRWVVLLRWGSSQAYGSSTCDVGVGVVCQGLAPLDGGDPDVLALGVLAGSPEYEVYDGLVGAPAWGGQVRRALTVSLVQVSCRRYQPGGVLRALPWRVARRRSGSRMVVGVRGGCSGSGGGGLGGLPGSCASTSMYGWPWSGSAGLGGAGRLLGWEMGFGMLWWCLGGVRMEMRGVCGARSGLVDVWVTHGMVMDETRHVFPGGGVGELFRVC